MALKTSKKDKILNMVYSLGASIVIIGALFKINHWTIPFIGIGGTEVLAVGLIVEAIIFIVFAFDPPVAEYEWEKVYPELIDSNAGIGKKPITSELKLMEEKIDGLLKEALIDAELLRGLKESFEKFGDSVNELNQSSEHAKKVSQQLSTLQENLTSINEVHKGLKESFEKFGDSINELNQSSEHAKKVNQQLSALQENLTSVNGVYEGMLSAMSSKK